MKIGKLTEWTTKTLLGGGLITAGSTQVIALSKAITISSVANLSVVTSVATKVAAAGFTLLGPFAEIAHSVFGAGAISSGGAGALSSFFGTAFGAGAITSFVVPLLVISGVLVAFSLLCDWAQKGGTMIDNTQDAYKQRIERDRVMLEKSRAQKTDPSISSPAPADPYHPADDALRRGVSYRENYHKSQTRSAGVAPG